MLTLPDARPHGPTGRHNPKPRFHGHFLAMIAFEGNITAQTVGAILAAQGKLTPTWRGWKFHFGEGQISSRNKCAHLFLQTDCKHLDFFDADILFLEQHVQALRRHPEAEDSIICGAYPKKLNDKIDYCYNSLKDGNPPPNERGLMEIAKGGTGFMQIPRSALERIMAAFPERFYDCDYDIAPDGTRGKKFSFFFQDVKVDEDSGLTRDLSEDWAFCWMARKAGVKIYLDVTTAKEPWIEHRGMAVYPPSSLIDLAKAQAYIAGLEKRILELDPATSAQTADGAPREAIDSPPKG
jgi:hypothetical protein